MQIWTSLMLSLSLAALAACASSEGAPPCAPVGRHGGERFAAFGERIADLPATTVSHVTHRTDRFATEVGILAGQTWEDVRETAHHTTGGLIGFLGEEIGRLGDLADFTGRQAQRTGRDARCFFERAWFHLKLLE
jgi:hypothetical protein